ncbi:hypothetical protein FKM82_019072 [Ascaphus truei]
MAFIYYTLSIISFNYYYRTICLFINFIIFLWVILYILSSILVPYVFTSKYLIFDHALYHIVLLVFNYVCVTCVFIITCVLYYLFHADSLNGFHSKTVSSLV